MQGKRILLIIGGGIAAYKSLLLIRLLRAAGAAVTPVLTRAGAEFVTPLSVSALAGEKVYSALFDLTDEAEMGHIQLSRVADLVLVALGVPRQETWIQRLHHGQPGLWMGVGGSFDVWSGTKQRAPSWMGRFQIEWLYRLIQEPSRWRRMLALPAFAWAVLRRG